MRQPRKVTVSGKAVLSVVLGALSIPAAVLVLPGIALGVGAIFFADLAMAEISANQTSAGSRCLVKIGTATGACGGLLALIALAVCISIAS